MLRCRSTHASMPKQKLLAITAPAEAAGKRLDQFLVSHLPNISRARIQQLISEKKILINDLKSKPSVRLRGGERITILGEPQPRPLRAIAEEIPLEIIYEDDDLAVINKPARMMVHAGSGATDDARNRGTRMRTRRSGGREAITHYAVQRRIDSKFGKFTQLELRIDTGRTHQIRVHLASLGHPVVGDTLYGAPRELRARNGEAAALSRNFLHAVALQFHHPRTGTALSLSSPLPDVLSQFLSRVQ